MAQTVKQMTPGHFSQDFGRYLTVVARTLGAHGFGLHFRDVEACWHMGRSVENVLAGIRAEDRRHAPVNQWAGQSVAQIVAGV